MKVVLVCAIVGVVALPCMAAETFTDTYNFGTDGILWDSESDCWTDNSSVSWAHYIEGLEDCQITQATLTIEGSGIDNVWWDLDGDGGYEQTDFVTVSFMGQTLGQLQGNSTTFDLSPSLIASAMNADAEITFQNDLIDEGCYILDFDWEDSVWLKNATLTVVAECPSAVVPAPGALILAGIGTILVGTLRRRKTI